MTYIKLEDDMSLVMTVRDTIYRGDNLNQKIRYLVPLKVKDIDMLEAYVYLNYIRADGTPDIVRLDRIAEKYMEKYYQYTLPVTCKLTRYAGQVCMWLQIYSGVTTNPVISKSGECVLHILSSKNMDDYICDHHVTALYKLERAVAGIEGNISNKADGISYDENTRELRLMSGESAVGNSVIVPADGYAAPGGGSGDDSGDTWGDMDGPGNDSGDGSGGDEWESM